MNATMEQTKKHGRSYKRILALLVFAVLTCGGLILSARILRRTDSEYKYRPFFEDNTEYDVIFYGTSHVLNAMHPMQLWKEHRIRSYNFGGHANSIAAAYWTLRLSTQYHKPKIAVLDMKGSAWDDTIMDVSYAHLSFDCFPLSRLKIQAIQDIFPQKKHQMEMLFPFSVYHNRWSDPEVDAVNAFLPKAYVSVTPEKGAELRVNLEEPASMELISSKKKVKEETVSMQYVRKFIEYCRQEDITPLLINIPYPASKKEQKAANKVADIAEETGVTYLNMQYMDLVDFKTDMYDEDSHLNASGAGKVTAYIGDYLSEECGLGVPGVADQASLDSVSDVLWEEDEKEYTVFLEDMMQGLELTNDIFVLLSNKHFSAEVKVPNERSLSGACRTIGEAMGERLTVSYTGEPFGDPHFKIYDREQGRLICEKDGQFG